MLGADIVVIEAAGLLNRKLDHLLSARGELLVGGGLALAHADDELHGAAGLSQLHAKIIEHARRNAFALADEAEQDMLRADVGVIEGARLFMRELQHLLGPLGKLTVEVRHCVPH